MCDIRVNQLSTGTIELTFNECTGIAVICIDNYAKRNSFNDQLMDQLSQVIDQLERWTTGKVVIIYGKNGFFSSGVDLHFVRQYAHNKEAGQRYSRLMHTTLSRLSALPQLTVAAISGQALGGGAEIATACDVRLMTKTSRVGFVQVLMGVSTGWSGGTRLVRWLGATRALDLLSSGRVLMANEALSMGLVSDVLTDTETDDQFIAAVCQWIGDRIGDCNQQIVTQLKTFVQPMVNTKQSLNTI